MADLKFLNTAAPRDRVVASKPHGNPNGEKIKLGGATVAHCKPDCDAEFRSLSHPSVIDAQLVAASWQVTLVESGDGKVNKCYRYRCPQHHVVDRARMSGVELAADRKQTKGERANASRASHDGGE